MKKIYNFIGPNGEYVEWGEFDGKKQQIVTLEVKKFYDDGVFAEKEQVDFIIPDNFDLNFKPQVVSSYRQSSSVRTNAPDQSCLVDKEADKDPREFLTD